MSAVRGALGSASELEPDLPFWLFMDALDEYVRGLAPARLDALGEDACAELALAFPLCPSSPTGAQSRPGTRGSELIGPCASCWRCSPSRSRSCSRWTTSSGRTPGRSSCWVRCCVV